LPLETFITFITFIGAMVRSLAKEFLQFYITFMLWSMNIMNINTRYVDNWGLAGLGAKQGKKGMNVVNVVFG